MIFLSPINRHHRFPIPSAARLISSQTWESTNCSDFSYEKEFAANSFGLQELKFILVHNFRSLNQLLSFSLSLKSKFSPHVISNDTVTTTEQTAFSHHRKLVN